MLSVFSVQRKFQTVFWRCFDVHRRERRAPKPEDAPALAWWWTVVGEQWLTGVFVNDTYRAVVGEL